MDMGSLLSTVLGNDGVVQKIGKKTGLSQDQLMQAAAIGLPMLLGGLAKNTASAKGAASLDDALANDHAQSALFDNPQKGVTTGSIADGEKILGHIFGQDSSQISDTIAKKIGTDSQSIMKLLAILSPFVLAYVARHKQDNNLDKDGVADALRQQKTPEGISFQDVVTQVLGMIVKK